MVSGGQIAHQGRSVCEGHQKNAEWTSLGIPLLPQQPHALLRGLVHLCWKPCCRVQLCSESHGIVLESVMVAPNHHAPCTRDPPRSLQWRAAGLRWRRHRRRGAAGWRCLCLANETCCAPHRRSRACPSPLPTSGSRPRFRGGSSYDSRTSRWCLRRYNARRQRSGGSGRIAPREPRVMLDRGREWQRRPPPRRLRGLSATISRPMAESAIIPELARPSRKPSAASLLRLRGASSAGNPWRHGVGGASARVLAGWCVNTWAGASAYRSMGWQGTLRRLRCCQPLRRLQRRRWLRGKLRANAPTGYAWIRNNCIFLVGC
mmetsp:Transcript_26477/g.70274  ORF Transcript_26477/g.70274 Transcript_26477/m.70274 type:complete len:318 (-) Transcript_26477:440-1393(-)